jgi:hypothetical protein
MTEEKLNKVNSSSRNLLTESHIPMAGALLGTQGRRRREMRCPCPGGRETDCIGERKVAVGQSGEVDGGDVTFNRIRQPPMETERDGLPNLSR